MLITAVQARPARNTSNIVTRQFLDNFGSDNHGPELSDQPKTPQIIAAETCLGEEGNKQTLTMLQQPPQRMITAEEELRVKAVLVS